MTRTIKLPVGSTYKLRPVFLDQNNRPMQTTQTITFASSDSTIATVDSNGLVTGIAAGTCTMTASSGSLTPATTSIAVYTPVVTGLVI